MIKFKDILTEFEINYEKNKDLYPVIKKMGRFQGSRLLESIQSDMDLNEMLNMSLNHSQIYDQIKTFTGIKHVNFNATLKQNRGTIDIMFKPDADLKKINQKMDAFGWYPSIIIFENAIKFSEFKLSELNHNKDTFIVRYEAKFDTPVNIDHLDYLYHITTDLAYDNIKFIGLTPKSQSKLANHPGRIYVLTGKSKIESTARALISSYKNKLRVKDILVLKIDCKYLQKHNFYEDPNFFIDEGLWTQQNIPPVAISVERIIPYSELN